MIHSNKKEKKRNIVIEKNALVEWMCLKWVNMCYIRKMSSSSEWDLFVKSCFFVIYFVSPYANSWIFDGYPFICHFVRKFYIFPRISEPIWCVWFFLQKPDELEFCMQSGMSACVCARKIMCACTWFINFWCQSNSFPFIVRSIGRWILKKAQHPNKLRN